MNRLIAVLAFAAAFVATSLLPQARAQTQPAEEDQSAFEQIMEEEVPDETLELGRQLVRLSGTGRTFDELLPTIAAQTKNAFVRANPQMQLGIIEVVDRMALSLVGRRRELDDMLARVWVSGFTPEEMQDLIEFYSTDTGKKYAELHPRLLGVEVTAADQWGRSVAAELKQLVGEELRAAMAAEQRALQGDIAGPAPEEPAEAPAQ